MIRTKTTAGLTLLEVLISLVIFAVAAVALGAAYVNTLVAQRAATTMNRENGDWRIARTLVLAEPSRLKAERGDELQLAGDRRLKWEARIEPTMLADLFQVTLRGRLQDAGKESGHEHAETFMVLRPTWSDPADRARLRNEAKARRQRGSAP